jgi:hypothetical protein
MGRIVMGVFLQFASVIAFTGWALYVWVHVKTYGSQPECNDQIKYVIMFITVRATVPWLRILWIAALVISAVGLMISFVYHAGILFAMRRVRKEEQAEETSSIENNSIRTDAIAKPWYLRISIPLLLCVVFSFFISSAYVFLLRSAIYATINLELTVSTRL